MITMEKYKYLEHTADAKFEAYGNTLEEAYENAAFAMADIITDTKEIEPKIKQDISIKSENRGSLLYDWLEKLLYLLDTEGLLPNIIKVKKIAKKDLGYVLTATIHGDIYKSKYEIKKEIKSITYNEMKIEENKKDNTWKITAVVDI